MAPPLSRVAVSVKEFRNERFRFVLLSADFWSFDRYENRSLKIWICDRKIDWIALSLVFIQAKVKFVIALN